MTDQSPTRFYVSSGSYYCVQCAGGGETQVAEEYGYTPLPNTEDELCGVYCCNCGRNDDENKDATRPGYAVHGDFQFTD